MSTATPARQGEVWFADLEPITGREQAGRRPVLQVIHRVHLLTRAR